MKNIIIIILFVFNCFLTVTECYRLGVGRADVTGPIAEVTLMGYGKFEQKGSGIHTRQYSKAYVVDDGDNRLVFVNVDVGMMADGVRIQVIKSLENMFDGLYNMDNVIISGTHTHSAVGGFLMHTFFDIPSGGFCRETFDALVKGIVKSVVIAHDSLQEGRLYLSTTTVLGVTVNRSPTSYLKNPEKERKMYPYDTDKEMTQLRFVSNDGQLLGAINWFPIHGTTLNNTNTLVSSDNIGYAALTLEKFVEKDSLMGQSKFVASFASSNLGDVSPNVDGPKCHQSGTECDATSKCSDMFEECYALGPGKDMYESVAMIGLKLAEGAWDLIKNSKGVEVTGSVQGIHQYVDMSKARGLFFNRVTKRVENIRGCLPAMGYSAGAGTTDGQFLPFLHQGMTKSKWWIDAIANVLARPTKEDVQCHFPKPILLASGHLNFPFEWQPKIVSTQLGKLGNLIIACVPGEFTTMSGRRMKNLLGEIFGKNSTVVISGLCNTYSDYIATFEEYQDQRYEAASTLFGPHTLNLHLMQYQNLANALQTNKTLERGPEPAGLDPDKMMSLIPPVVFDNPKRGHGFGDVLVQPEDVSTNVINDTSSEVTVGANPRNNLRLDDTFLTIEKRKKKKLENGNDVEIWEIVATDADYNTKMHWRRTNPVEGTSEVDVEWKIFKSNVKPGTYRFKYFGDYKSLIDGTSWYESLIDLKVEGF
ncbi:Neutral ceramidase precursor, putative [Pediculus humanus corporis]|uniref:Neutral ceramidase n=1 Tax=Pediculus humanus subsp. corporis TaxID=121224 RepID=E0VXY8_PEDHC|nr:Neutral ceramidase precursor, putative [Pediculus humanus corporis]EEB18244.1 Neutral ceramidase precursor, putative [Pediculus humanus corporis]